MPIFHKPADKRIIPAHSAGHRHLLNPVSQPERRLSGNASFTSSSGFPINRNCRERTILRCGLLTRRAPAQNFPNVVLRTHDNKRARLYDDLIRDKVALINFFYTSCTSACELASG